MAKHLYKYTTLSTGLAILKSRAFRFSSPISFNDPFDVQRRCVFEPNIDETIDDFLVEFERLATSNVSLRGVRKSWKLMLEELRPLVKKHGYKKSQLEAQLRLLLKSSFPSDSDIREIKATVEECITNWLVPIRVFCMAEDWSVILMWSHYSNNHRGLVFELVPYRGKLFPKVQVRKVEYRDSPHIMFDRKGLVSAQVHGPGSVVAKMSFDNHLFRKAAFWDYEKEWRAILNVKSNHADQFVDVPFKLEQIRSITFGCMCSDSEVDEFKNECSILGQAMQFFRCVQSDERYAITREPV